MKFKIDRVNKEFYNDLPIKNKKLYTILMLLDNFTQVEYSKEVTVTHIFRTPEEQKELYAQTPNPPSFSPHLIWRAADIRSSDFTDPQIKKMLGFLNCFSYDGGQGKPVALYHAITGNTWHFHIQA